MKTKIIWICYCLAIMGQFAFSDDSEVHSTLRGSFPGSGLTFSPSLREVLSPEAKAPLDALAALGRQIPFAQRAELFAYMRHIHGLGNAPISVRVLKNDMMALLCRQTYLPPELTDQLIFIYRDLAQDIVIRDYALQHLGELYGRIDNPEEKQRVKDVFWDAVEHSDSSLAGTGLLALQRMVSTKITEDYDRLTQAAVNIIGDKNAALINRITALNLGVVGQSPAVQAIAADILRNQSAEECLRMAAQAVIRLNSKSESQSTANP